MNRISFTVITYKVVKKAGQPIQSYISSELQGCVISESYESGVNCSNATIATFHAQNSIPCILHITTFGKYCI